MLKLELLRKRFGREIALYRIEKRISQEELSKRMNISRSKLSTIENGISPFDDFVLLALYKECGQYLFFMILYAFYGTVIRDYINTLEDNIYKPLLENVLNRIRKLGPVDRPRYYDNDIIRVVYKPDKDKNT